MSVLMLFLLLGATKAQSQEYFDWEWDDYSISFTLADDFKPVTNTGEEFTAKGDGMDISIFPFNDASVAHTDISSYTADIAETVELQVVDDANVLQLNGLKGAYVEGYKDGQRVVLLGFIDPETATNFFAVITFDDNDSVAEDEAIKIVSSFRKK